MCFALQLAIAKVFSESMTALVAGRWHGVATRNASCVVLVPMTFSHSIISQAFEF